MKICICDDEKVIHEDIKKRLKATFSETDSAYIKDIFSGEELIESYRSGDKFDIIFLDIEMGKINGIDSAIEVRKYSSDAIIIFISSYKNYVFDAFKCEAFHFIVKPIEQSEFEDVFKRAIFKYKNMNNKYLVSWKNSREMLAISDITYVEGYHRRLKVHTTDEVYEHVGKINETYKKLEPHGFVLLHQGFIVNMNYIKTFGNKEVYLQDGTKIMISGRKRPEAIQIYDKFIQNWKW